MNRNRKKTGIVCMAVVMTLANTTGVCNAAVSNTPKEENVFANLNSDGSVDGIYVVNEYQLDEDTEIVDYGTYSSLKNLTNDQELVNEDGSVVISADQGKFYYQGNLESTDLPWNISIQYSLDGKEIDAADLAGQSGKLKMTIQVTKNDNVNETFFEQYMMQVTVTLDSKLCTNIEAEGATSANSGDDKQLLYNIMAGNEKEIVITADVVDFTMDSISFKGIDTNFDIDTDSIDTSELYEQTGTIKDAATELNDGAQSLSEGTQSASDAAKELSDGMDQLADAVNQLSEGSDQIKDALTKLDSKSESLTNGSSQVLKALNQIDSQLENVEVSNQSLTQLVTASNQLQTGIHSLSDGIATLNSSLDYSAMNKVIWSGLSKKTSGTATEENKNSLAAALTSDEIGTVLAQLPDGELKTALSSYVSAAQSYVSITKAYDSGLSSYLSTVQGSVDSKSGSAYLTSQAAVLSENYDEFNSNIQTLSDSLSTLADSMTTLKEAINTLVVQYTTLDAGITSYADGVAQVLSGYETLDAGLTSLSDGAVKLQSGSSELSDGMAELNDGAQTMLDGTTEFEEQTADIDEVIEGKISSMVDEMLGGEFEVVSFVSEQNTNVDAVQFVMKTEAINLPEVEEVAAETEQQSFWEKLIALFVK